VAIDEALARRGQPVAPTSPSRPDGAAPGEIGGDSSGGGEPVTRLRGAGVEVDARRAGAVVVGICLAGLVVAVVALFQAGAARNARISRLRQHGVATQITVTGCLGLLGGSGSNSAGYACRGSYTVGGHRYEAAIPGDELRAPGTRLAAVSVAGDPSIFSTTSALAGERVSSRVYLLPVILLAALVLVIGGLAVRLASAGSVLARRPRQRRRAAG
jgi:hypothetical protein